jgi:RNA polymerase sigma-70 factor (ECF subfamily)
VTSDPSFDTFQLLQYLERVRAGDRAGVDDFLRRVCGRLGRMARRMLRGFPNVGAWADTDDVLQSALMRLLHTLRAVTPASTQEFAHLAALHIRRELLDLARKYRGRLDAARGAAGDEGSPDPVAALADRDSLRGDLDHWAAFHEAVGQLPAREGDVMSLKFYHGLTEEQIAGLLGLSDRQIRRYWRAACMRLCEVLGGDMPEA